MTVFRDGKDQNVTLKLGEQPEDLSVVAGEKGPAHRNNGGAAANAEAFGMTFSSVTEELAEQYNLAGRAGVVVTAVKPKSPAFKAGLRPGDMITKVGNTPVKNAADASAALAKQDAKKGVRLYVTGPEGSRFVFIEGSQQ